MIIMITYMVPTANGFWKEHYMTASSFEEAEEICEAIERNGYKLVDVTRDVYAD